MKNIYRLLIFLIVSTLSQPLFAQSASITSDTLRWNASGFTDKLANVTVNKGCQFITYGNGKADWIQGNYVLTFQVSNVSTSWQDLSANGKATYTISNEAISGQLIISRTGSGLTIQLKLTEGTDDINNLYTITTFDKH